MLPRLNFILLILIALLVFPMRQVFATPEVDSDVRIIIDVSGSMKKNDPNNLRSPAVRMLVGLLPEGELAGVWTFAKFVNMLVPHGKVDDAWRKKAEQQSKKIHSFGLYTDIEQVLDKASKNNTSTSVDDRKSIILLSDGLVDISKQTKVSAASRQRILDKLVPRLKKENIAVHTIALANTADHELLRTLSLETDGWYEQADTAQALQRIFLHLFEKAAQRDTLPLIANHFKVDDSVSEMTLLVFRQADSKPTELIMPDKSRLTRVKPNSSVLWHTEAGYDLITIDNPMSGGWKIDADLDPDNRVMVITNLQLEVTDLPNNILIGETFDVEASLTEKGKRIERTDFLDFVDATLSEESEITDRIDQSLNDSLSKGLYQSHVGETFQAGRNDVVVSMISPTFERQRRQSINVVDTPFIIDIHHLDDQPTRTSRVTLKPDTTLIKNEGLVINAMLTASDGSEWSYDVVNIADQQWQLTLADLSETESYQLALQIRGETLKGRKVFLQPKPILLPENIIDEPVEQEEIPVESTEEQNSTQEPDSESLEPKTEETPIVDEMMAADTLPLPGAGNELTMMDITDEMKGTDDETPMSSSLMLIIGNGVIILFIGLGIFLWRRSVTNSKNPGDDL
jgi:uncharacterized protein (TIGR03503 family)